MRTAVRKNYELGAHHIKITLIDGALSGLQRGKKFQGGQSNFTKEEIQALVEEAHRLGMKVTAHASGESIRLALEAGVDSIQHGEQLTEALLGVFRAKNAGLINTFTVGFGRHLDAEWKHLDAEAASISEWIERCRKVIAMKRASDQMLDRAVRSRWRELKMAKDHGVSVGVGTDHMPGLLPLEIITLVDAGFSEIEAIAAATGTNAKILGIDSEVGTVQKGRFADLIAVEGAPDKTIGDLTRVQFIMLRGRERGPLSFR
jgi:imidazolonepropionase-like amidohydrolase